MLGLRDITGESAQLWRRQGEREEVTELLPGGFEFAPPGEADSLRPGLATRAGGEPAALTSGLPGERLQHEHSLVAIQDVFAADGVRLPIMISAAVVSEALRLRNKTFSAQSRSDTIPISLS